MIFSAGSRRDEDVSDIKTGEKTEYFNLAPGEVRVANLVKNGKIKKEIVELLCISKIRYYFVDTISAQSLG